MGFRIIDPEKLRKVRADRSLELIAAASGGKFSRGALWQWEQKAGGPHSTTPTNDKIPALLRALGCTYEDISKPAELETV